MIKKRGPSSEINIDEASHVRIRTFRQKLRDALVAIAMGVLLVQMYFFWSAFQTGYFGMGVSVVVLYDNFYFLVYLGLCGIFGWMKGQRFIDWLNVKTGYWKFW